MRQQAINPVGRFANVFQQQHPARQGRAVLGAQQVGCHGEVACEQGAFGDSGLPALPLQRRQRLAGQQITQPGLAPVRLAGQGGDQRSMDGAAEPGGLLRPQQAGDIGEAQEPALGRLPALLQEPRGAPAATGAGPKFSVPFEIGHALGIAAGVIAPMPGRIRRRADRVAPAAQQFDALLEAFGLPQGGTGGHDFDVEDAHPMAMPRPSTRPTHSSVASHTCRWKWRPIIGWPCRSCWRSS